MALPTLHHRIAPDRVRVVTVWDRASASLVGVFPLAERRLRPALPLKVAELWSHIYAVSATPLVDAARAGHAIEAFLNWAARSRMLVRFPEVRADSAFAACLGPALERTGARSLVERSWTRAFFVPDVDADAYISKLGSAHHRKEWRRQQRQLRETGSVEFDALGPDGDVARWLDEFTELEARGWKGRSGSAFGSTLSHREWLSEVTCEAFARGRLDLIALRLDRKPIAMRLSLMTPPGAHAFKIAYDEAHLKHSPGVMLELENIRRLHARADIRWMDSLAAPGHSLMERVWSGRAQMSTLLVAPGEPVGWAVVAMLPALRRLKGLLSRPRRDK